MTEGIYIFVFKSYVLAWQTFKRILVGDQNNRKKERKE
ncbi:hypothetical protein SLEP1_g50635 [Rubroshorea leprosula]|uniref:Photosystem II protein T n=1 Tax=Rubroshorea leprosula TaxID=152421 RepID=A0AAV5M384_9ROSI|nr:hypothetical protein SLEP1_g50635 [Rubroshorea leprosula]